MDYEKVTLVVCLTLFIVIGINAAIYAMLYKGGAIQQVDIFRRATDRMRSPWKDEDEALKELSHSVSQLKQRDNE